MSRVFVQFMKKCFLDKLIELFFLFKYNIISRKKFKNGETMNTTIRRDSTSSQIYDYLLSQITSGNWSVGYKLPTESVLAEKFDVSRSSIREALQRLRALGIIESYQGKGTFVSTNTLFEAVGTILSNISVSEKQFEELLEFRKIFEPYCVKKAIENATEEQIEKLSQYAPLPETLHIEGLKLEKYVFQLDIQFHKTIVEMTGNSLFQSIYDVISEIREAHTSYFLAIRMDYHQILQDHFDIYEMIKKADIESAVTQMFNHLMSVNHYFNRSKPEY